MNVPHDEQKQAADALRLLARVSPPEGMEQRILARTQAAQAEVASQPVRHKPARRLVWPLVLAGPALAGLVVAGVLAHRPAPAPAPKQQTAEVAMAPAISPVEVQPRNPEVRTLAIHPAKKHVRSHRSEVRHAVVRRSFPAPAAPLTEQERLLVEAVSERQPAVMKALASLAQPMPTVHIGSKLGQSSQSVTPGGFNEM